MIFKMAEKYQNDADKMVLNIACKTCLEEDQEIII